MWCSVNLKSFTVRLLLPLSGAGSRCFLQVFEMVILFNRDCLVHQIAHIKHFCFLKKYVQLRWKTWSCSFSVLPKGKCFLSPQENIFFIKAWRRVISHQNFLWEKFLLINSSPYSGEGLFVLQLLLVGAAWSEMWWLLSNGDVLLWQARVCSGTLGRDRAFWG